MIAASCPPLDVRFLARLFVLVGDAVAHLRVATLTFVFVRLVPVSADTTAFGVSGVESRTPNHALQRTAGLRLGFNHGVLAQPSLSLGRSANGQSLRAVPALVSSVVSDMWRCGRPRNRDFQIAT